MEPGIWNFERTQLFIFLNIISFPNKQLLQKANNSRRTIHFSTQDHRIQKLYAKIWVTFLLSHWQVAVISLHTPDSIITIQGMAHRQYQCPQGPVINTKLWSQNQDAFQQVVLEIFRRAKGEEFRFSQSVAQLTLPYCAASSNCQHKSAKQPFLLWRRGNQGSENVKNTSLCPKLQRFKCKPPGSK